MFPNSRIFILVVLNIFFLHRINCDSCPHIYSRDSWNASQPVQVKLLKEIPAPYVVVHHSATQTCNTTRECKALIKSIQNYHIENNGWEDIGYNFLIGADGSIYEGRGWNIHGAHAIKYNARSNGICLLGNFEENTPPIPQLEALGELINCGKDTNKITNDYHLIGHQQANPTLCPGKYLFGIIKHWPHFDNNPN